jgi:outer membrane immunogenic protein
MKSTSVAAIAGLGALVLGAAQHAHAADLAVSRPLLAPDATWTGFYGGINLGGFAATGTAQWDPLTSPAAFGFNDTTANMRTDGVTVGIQAGYNFQLSPFFVTGIEGDITNDHTSAKTIQSWTTFGTNAVLSGSSVPEIRTLEWLGTLRGRFGYLLAPRTLVYATGGVAWSGVNYAAASTGPIGPGYASSVSFTQTDIGYVVGGGVEFMNWDRWLVRGEYLFHHFNGASAVGGAVNFPMFPSGFTWSGFDVHEFRAALSYKF